MFAVMSPLHCVWMLSANQPMFATHCSALGSVLHVPQIMVFRREMFRWLCFDHNPGRVSFSSPHHQTTPLQGTVPGGGTGGPTGGPREAVEISIPRSRAGPDAARQALLRNALSKAQPDDTHTDKRENGLQDEKSLNRLTVINAFESETSSENGRHVRNGSPCVMFVKNVWHPTVVKFVDSELSNGCGNGAGSCGAVEGTCVLLDPAAVGAAGAEGATDRVENEAVEAVTSMVVASSTGCGCLLCGCQDVPDSARLCQFDRGRSASKIAGWERYRVDRPTSTRTRGMRTTAHLVLRPVRFLCSSAYA